MFIEPKIYNRRKNTTLENSPKPILVGGRTRSISGVFRLGFAAAERPIFRLEARLFGLFFRPTLVAHGPGAQCILSGNQLDF